MNVILWTIVISLVGIAVGSFLNVVIFRSEKKLPLTGRSKCLTCQEPVTKLDLIPIISFFALKGRCRRCTAVIEWQYPIIEIVTGVLFGLLFVRAFAGVGFPYFVDNSQWLLLFVRDVVMVCFLLIIFVYDFKYSYILDRFTIPAMILALLFNIALGADATSLLFSGLLLGSFFAFQFLISNGRWIGGGDIRMGLLMGFFLGITNGLVALFVAYIIGAAAGIILITFKKRKADSHVPFGTFLALGTLVAMFWGTQILDWYLGLLG
ncbi:prepilin peptidase [Candidatus Uhrbacteria bacterium CG_4_9_14_0_2_um_filter_41_50]|uniref:Prepilin peptidase n=1 Tax=Candidatus Uhrbacteria bacterium CG_4_9_14_0_2_um_filter_41_50 TaxID=1975031 RepID=A0A2M8ENA4_9BACT|nr:MAG: prepilin peptidase [Candidatus Uhrbacteria bacterium CG_4_10_14_3_um_filter_41_21]PIZ54207.1 MAG: prepilin peptidase [Candidatus Uhrbacteria bacterium CG_4_10_14_0_2_um_filter_41_21]PJB84925.1 MAG: prepilin peptidase [Candidatus Uhrbacteria bacterium CG_4_9_14_0_8_um_filter_41_16]PJC24191.1 MAG: prepilin peptidase [Candidatus Uhrbacteria bacterium CG_4_9_14_0_2_um_filter_41_50]PJE74648.1 MAG: prepilin peptidase [Candidatus Uhrbacteria bacterium CG10_big_fil_rev_8_21_14_0_10_41_26]